MRLCVWLGETRWLSKIVLWLVFLQDSGDVEMSLNYKKNIQLHKYVFFHSDLKNILIDLSTKDFKTKIIKKVHILSVCKNLLFRYSMLQCLKFVLLLCVFLSIIQLFRHCFKERKHWIQLHFHMFDIVSSFFVIQIKT